MITDQTYLSEVQVDETQGEKLQAHWAAVQEPVDWGGQVVGCHSIAKVKGKKRGAQGCPEKA